MSCLKKLPLSKLVGKRTFSLKNVNEVLLSLSTDSPFKRYTKNHEEKIITKPELSRLVSDPKKGKVLIDLRTPEEIECSGYIPTACFLPG